MIILKTWNGDSETIINNAMHLLVILFTLLLFLWIHGHYLKYTFESIGEKKEIGI